MSPTWSFSFARPCPRTQPAFPSADCTLTEGRKHCGADPELGLEHKIKEILAVCDFSMPTRPDNLGLQRFEFGVALRGSLGSNHEDLRALCTCRVDQVCYAIKRVTLPTAELVGVSNHDKFGALHPSRLESLGRRADADMPIQRVKRGDSGFLRHVCQPLAYGRQATCMARQNKNLRRALRRIGQSSSRHRHQRCTPQLVHGCNIDVETPQHGRQGRRFRSAYALCGPATPRTRTQRPHLVKRHQGTFKHRHGTTYAAHGLSGTENASVSARGASRSCPEEQAEAHPAFDPIEPRSVRAPEYVEARTSLKDARSAQVDNALMPPAWAPPCNRIVALPTAMPSMLRKLPRERNGTYLRNPLYSNRHVPAIQSSSSSILNRESLPKVVNRQQEEEEEEEEFT